MNILQYLKSMKPSERESFATRCGTTVGNLNNIAWCGRKCSAGLAIAIERESGGTVVAETLCPDVDWGYIRGTIPVHQATLQSVAEPGGH